MIRRFTAAAAGAWLLAGCSWFGLSDGQTNQVQSHAGSGERAQFAALPSYNSDENFALETDNKEQITAPPIPRAKPIAPVQHAQPMKRVVLTLAEIMRNAKSVSYTAMPPLAASIDPAERTLADVMKDQAWRRRTSRKLEYLLR